MIEIKKDTIIGDILDVAPQTAPIFFSIGMHCLGCPSSRGETVEEACTGAETRARRSRWRLWRIFWKKRRRRGSVVTVNDVTQMMFRWAPPELAMDWDNVGLLVGRGDREVHRVLVALDVSPDVAAEAAETGTDLIVSHHPVMNIRWHAQQMQTLREDTRLGGLLTELVKRDISAMCMHTNLDAAEGGVNDCLACTLGLQDTKPLNEEKIGRIGTLSCEKPLEQFLSDVVKLLSCNGLRYRDGGRPVHRVAVGGGACGEYIPQAIAQGCDTFVTSDLRYNDFLDTQGLNLIDAGHFPTEDVVCQEIVRRLRETFPELEVTKSAVHGDAVKFYMR